MALIELEQETVTARPSSFLEISYIVQSLFKSTSLNTVSDGHDKPFCTKAITIINNFKKARDDSDKSQFLKAISVIDKLSPINFQCV